MKVLECESLEPPKGSHEGGASRAPERVTLTLLLSEDTEPEATKGPAKMPLTLNWEHCATVVFCVSIHLVPSVRQEYLQ